MQALARPVLSHKTAKSGREQQWKARADNNQGEFSMANLIKRRNALYFAAASVASIPFFGSPALAQVAQPAESATSATNDDVPNDDIVVTAERRETKLQDTALSIAALSGNELRDRQITNPEALLQSLTNVQFAVNKTQPKIAIRGVGLQNISVSGPESRIAFNLDGVYLARPEAIMGAFFDVQRIEILRGPQGTLYGRNATGGAINVITADPTDKLSGYLNLGYGNYNTLTAAGAISGPIGDKISARLAFTFEDRDGYGRNITTGNRVDNGRPRAVRLKVKFAPTDNFDITLSSDYMRQKANIGAYYYTGPYTSGRVIPGIALGGVATTADRAISSDYDPYVDDERYGFAMDVHGTLGSVDLRSITGYRVLNDYETRGDVDVSSLPLSYATYFARSRQVSQEVRLSQKTGAFEWLLGGYFFHENLTSANAQGLSAALFGPGAPISPIRQGSTGGGFQETTAYAIFGQVRYDLSQHLTLSLGGRYGWETTRVNETNYLDLVDPFAGPFDVAKGIVPPGATGVTRQADSRSSQAFTPKVTLEYRPRENFLAYATYSKGFKSGGYNLGSVQPSFAPEKLTNYEAGIKASWLDRILQTNITVFHYDYRNLQVTTLTTINNITSNVTTNAGRAKVDGVEAELVLRPIDSIKLEVNYAYLDARYVQYSALNPNKPQLGVISVAGNRLSQAPQNSLSAAAEYSLETAIGEFKIRGEGNWVDRTFYNQFEEYNVSTPSHAQYNAFLTYTSLSEKWTASAYIRNITNETVVRPNVVYPPFLGSPVVASLEPPRLYGVTLGYRF
jgi:iron complex outermembrane receptor protein